MLDKSTSTIFAFQNSNESSRHGLPTLLIFCHHNYGTTGSYVRDQNTGLDKDWRVPFHNGAIALYAAMAGNPERILAQRVKSFYPAFCQM